MHTISSSFIIHVFSNINKCHFHIVITIKSLVICIWMYLRRDNIPGFHCITIYSLRRIVTYSRVFHTYKHKIGYDYCILANVWVNIIGRSPTRQTQTYHSLADWFLNPFYLFKSTVPKVRFRTVGEIVLCMGGFSPLWMQEGSTNKICDLKATARCRLDEAAQASGKGIDPSVLVGRRETEARLAIWRNASTSFNRYALRFVG